MGSHLTDIFLRSNMVFEHFVLFNSAHCAGFMTYKTAVILSRATRVRHWRCHRTRRTTVNKAIVNPRGTRVHHPRAK
jgi:hypothetical protein